MPATVLHIQLVKLNGTEHVHDCIFTHTWGIHGCTHTHHVYARRKRSTKSANAHPHTHTLVRSIMQVHTLIRSIIQVRCRLCSSEEFTSETLKRLSLSMPATVLHNIIQIAKLVWHITYTYSCVDHVRGAGQAVHRREHTSATGDLPSVPRVQASANVIPV